MIQRRAEPRCAAGGLLQVRGLPFFFFLFPAPAAPPLCILSACSYSQGRSGHGAARQGATSTKQRWRFRSEGFGGKFSTLRVLDSHNTRFWRFFKCWLEKKPAGGVPRRRQGAPVACREWKRCVCLLAPPLNPQLSVVTMSRLSEPPDAPGEV